MEYLDRDNVQNLPESPASVTARVVTDKGFHILFTVRDISVAGLFEKFEQFQKEAIAKGWKPEAKSFKEDDGVTLAAGIKGGSSPVKASQQAICSVCGAPAKKKSGYRKDGSIWEGVFCSTGDESHKVWLS